MALRTAGLQQEQQGIILSDLAQARAHLVFILQVKMAHWGRLPYLLFGLAHHSPMVAVVAAKAALEVAQSSGALLEEQPTWAQRVLQPVSAGHLELHCFAEGGSPLVELPVLLQLAAELRFVPTVERHVEALHSILHRNLAGRPSAGPVHVAFTSVLPRLRQAVRANPAGFVEQFALACAKVSNGVKGLAVVGLSQHPGVQALGGVRHGIRRSLVRNHYREFVNIIYHTDDATLFQDRAGFADIPLVRPHPQQRYRCKLRHHRGRVKVKTSWSASSILNCHR